MIGVILCGGVGSRLWPVSRDLYPKPFLKLSDGYSFIQKTFIRSAALPEAEGIITVTSGETFFKVRDELTETGLTLESGYILEPFGKNTAPAIAMAALNIAEHHSLDTLMMVLPSDHLIRDGVGYNVVVKEAMELARKGYMVTFGIKPDHANTGFGYIEADGNRVIRFVEKPSIDTAEEYVKSGRFLWNSGMFCFKAGVLIDELQTHAPEMLEAVKRCYVSSLKDDQNVIHLDPSTFQTVPSNSIDFAVMEKASNVAVVNCDIGWNDVGSWNELCDLDPIDENGNHIANANNFVAIDARNCNISNKEKLIAVLGVENLLIVDTADAILVADKRRSQDVREIYNTVKSKNHEAYKQHRTVHRPWGSYSILETGERFKIKKLLITPGSSISLQLHYHRSEHWIVVSGMAKVTCDNAVYLVHTNESTYLKAGCKHRVSNPGKINLVIIEVQSGDYLGENDIERFEDLYGRE